MGIISDIAPSPSSCLQNKILPSFKPFPTITETLVHSLSAPFRLKKDHASVTILENVSLLLEPGKSYLLLGPPKSGKTSLLKAIAGK